MRTLHALIEGQALYLLWWLRALGGWRDPAVAFGPRRWLLLLAGVPTFLLVQAGHGMFLLLDELLFPRYRAIRVKDAILITGIPRSGTTYLHRTLAVHGSGYTTFRTWEALLAPSITQRRLIRLADRIDRRLGGPMRRVLEAVTKWLGRDLETVHRVRLDAAEEDYLTLLPTAGCFIMLLAFPAAPGLQGLGQFHTAIGAQRRQRLLRFYYRNLQRHMYANGATRILLSKNAAFGSWTADLAQWLPSARFLICIREPHQALVSQLKAIESARVITGARVDAPTLQGLFLDTLSASLEHLSQTLPGLAPDRYAVIDMEDLHRDPATVVRAALARVGANPDPLLEAHLTTLEDSNSAPPMHDLGILRLDPERMRAQLLPPYQRLLILARQLRP